MKRIKKYIQKLNEPDKVEVYLLKADVSGLIDVLPLAKLFHEIYEIEAEKAGWKTQKKCRVKFSELPKENKETMLRVEDKIKDFIKAKIEG